MKTDFGSDGLPGVATADPPARPTGKGWLTTGMQSPVEQFEADLDHVRNGGDLSETTFGAKAIHEPAKKPVITAATGLRMKATTKPAARPATPQRKRQMPLVPQDVLDLAKSFEATGRAFSWRVRDAAGRVIEQG